MGSDHSRSTGGQSVEVGRPDYYHSLQVNEDATDDELKVRQLEPPKNQTNFLVSLTNGTLQRAYRKLAVAIQSQ